MLRMCLISFLFLYSPSGLFSKQLFADQKDSSFAGRPIKFYLKHTKIPQVCKDLYTGKRPASDDNDVLALMDSIFTRNKETRPFYFLTLMRTFKGADGAYAEPLGIMAKKFAETHTKEFLNYFLNEPAITSSDFNQWALQVCPEIRISFEDHEPDEIEKLRKTMLSNCKTCDQRQKQKLEDFIKKVRKHCAEAR